MKPIILIALFSIFNIARCTHFRFGHTSWSRVIGHPYRVKFDHESAWRNSFNPNWGNRGPSWETVGVGEVVPGVANFEYGDDSPPYALGLVKNTVNLQEDWMIGTQFMEHDFDQPGDYVAFWDKCCRISRLLGDQNDDDVMLQFKVGVNEDLSNGPVPGTNMYSPRSTTVPIIYLKESETEDEAQTFTIPGLDEDGDTIIFSINTEPDMDKGGTGTVPPLKDPTSGVTADNIWVELVDASKGTIDAYTYGKRDPALYLGDEPSCDPCGMWTMQVILDDQRGGVVALDFIIQVVDKDFDYPYIVWSDEPRRAGPAGFQFDVEHPFKGQITTRTPDKDSILEAPRGDEFVMYIHGISLLGADVEIFTNAVPRTANAIVLDSVPSLGSPVADFDDFSDILQMRWVPGAEDSDIIMCFSIQETTGSQLPGLSQHCVTIHPTDGDLLYLPGFIRDFSHFHPDFGYTDTPIPTSAVTGMVQDLLSDAKKPLVANIAAWNQGKGTNLEDYNWFETQEANCNEVIPATNNPLVLCGQNIANQQECESLLCCWANFQCTHRRADLYTDNLETVYSLTLTNAITTNSTVFGFRSTAFYPIDGRLLGNEELEHNRDFTMELHTFIKYTGSGMFFEYESSDDLWVFIDGKLAVDLGGIHERTVFTLSLDDLDLTTGTDYTYDIYYASRQHVGDPFLRIELTEGSACDAISTGSYQFNYDTNFDSTHFVTNGVVPISPTYITLASADRPDNSATIFHNAQQRVQGGFRTEFTYHIENLGAASQPDGFAFIIQTSGVVRGGSASNLGYGDGIKFCLAVEFDMSRDSSKNDPSSGHISIQTRGLIPNSANADYSLGSIDVVALSNPANDETHNIAIDYTPFSTTLKPLLRVFFDDMVVPAVSSDLKGLSLSNDILGSDGQAYVGFSYGSSANPVDIIIDKWSLKIVDPGASLSYAYQFPTRFVAGFVDSFKIQLRDVCGNDITVGGHLEYLTVTFHHQEEDVTILPHHIADNEDGTYTVEFIGTRAGFYDVPITLTDRVTDGQTTPLKRPILDSPYVVEVVPGPTYAPNCFAFNFDDGATDSFDLWNGVCANTFTMPTGNSFIIQAMDQFYNKKRSGDGNIFTVQGFGGGEVFTGNGYAAITGGISIPVIINDNGDGTHSVFYYTRKAGEYEVLVKYLAQDIGTGGKNDYDTCLLGEGGQNPPYDDCGPPWARTAQVTYESPHNTRMSPGPAHHDASDISGQPLNAVRAGVPVTFYVSTQDVFGNPRAEFEPDDVVVLTTSIDPHTVPAALYVIAWDDTEGLYAVSMTFYVASTNDGFASPLNDDRYQVTIGISDSDCDDANDNDLYDCSGSISPDISILIIPAKEHHSFTVPVPPLNSRAQATIPSQFMIIVRDEYENERIENNDELSFSFTVTDPDGIERPGYLNTVTGNELGQYYVDWTPQKTGEYTIDIRLGGEPIKDSPLTIDVVPGPISQLSTVLSGYPEDAEVGVYNEPSFISGFPQYHTFTVEAYDAANNLRDVGTVDSAVEELDDTDQLTLITTPNYVGHTIIKSITDDGQYNVFWWTETRGDYLVELMTTDINALEIDNILNDRFTVELHPGPIDGPESYAQGSGFSGGVVDTVVEFNIYARDRFGNPVFDTDGALNKEDDFTLSFSRDTGPITMDRQATDEDLTMTGGYKIVHDVDDTYVAYYVVPTVDQAAVDPSIFTIQVYLDNYVADTVLVDENTGAYINQLVGQGLSYSRAMVMQDTYQDGTNLAATVAGVEAYFTIQDQTYLATYTLPNVFNDPIEPGANCVYPMTATGGADPCGTGGIDRGPLTPSINLIHTNDPNSVARGEYDDNLDGTYTVAYTAFKAGDYQVKVEFGGEDIMAPSYSSVADPDRDDAGGFHPKTDLTVIHGDPHPPNFEVMLDLSIPAGTPSQIIVHLYDPWKNRIDDDPAASAAIVVTFNDASFDATVNSQDGSSGDFNFTYTPVKVTTVQVSISYQGTPASTSPFQVQITPGDVYAPKSHILKGDLPSQVVAGTTGAFTMRPADPFGNLLAVTSTSYADDVWSAQIVGPEILNTSFVSTDEDGDQYVASFSPTIAGQYEIIAHVDGEVVGTDPLDDSVKGPYFIEVVPASAARGVFMNGSELASFQAATSFTAYESGNLIVEVFDEFGNLRSSDDEDDTLLITATISSIDQVSNQTKKEICDVVRDQSSGGYVLQCSGTVAGSQKVIVAVNNQVSSSEGTLIVTPAETYAPACIIGQLDPNPGIAQEDGQIDTPSTCVTFTTRDEFENIQDHRDNDIEVEVYVGSPTCGREDVFLKIQTSLVNIWSIEEIPGEPSEYRVCFQSQKAGVYSFHIDIEGETISDKDCPTDLQIIPGPLHPPSTVWSNDKYYTTAGERAAFTLEFFDRFSNPLTTVSPDAIFLRNENADDFADGHQVTEQGGTTQITVTDFRDGTAEVLYYSELAGIYPMTVVIQGYLPGQPDLATELPQADPNKRQIEIRTAKIDADATKHPQDEDDTELGDMWVDPESLDSDATAIAAIPECFILQANDKFANPIFDAYTNFSFSAIGQRQEDDSYDLARPPEFYQDVYDDHKPSFRRLCFTALWDGTYLVSTSLLTCANEDGMQVFEPCSWEELRFKEEVGFSPYDLYVEHATCAGEYGMDTPYRCENRDCVESYDDCDDDVDTVGKLEDDDSCVALVGGSAVLCNDLYCVITPSHCPQATTCPDGFENCANDRTQCRKGQDDCPNKVVCSPGWEMCSNGITCVRDVSECADVTTDLLKFPCDLGFVKCADGSCVFQGEDCPTSISCGDPGLLVCASDLSCREDRDQCPDQYECYAPFSFRCPTGECRQSLSDCPSRVTCPVGFIRCETGHCVDDFGECPEYDGWVCDYDEVRCPIGICKPNLLHCPTTTTCPDNDVLCPDGSCRSYADGCLAVQGCPQAIHYTWNADNERSATLVDQVRCLDGACVMDYEFCPTVSACTVDYPVKCPDGSCQENIDICPDPVICPTALPYQCSDLSCKATTTQCSVDHQCAASAPFKCGADNSCRTDAYACPDASQTQCPETLPFKCPGGACSGGPAQCPTQVSCPVGYSKCADQSCHTSCDDIAIQICPKGDITCPDGVSCRRNIGDCPTGVVCSTSLPYKCSDTSCVGSPEDCPIITMRSDANCRFGFSKCGDMSCHWAGAGADATGACGTGVTCPLDYPYKCYDSSCRALPEDCPQPPICPGDKGWLCANGVCVDNVHKCGGLDAKCAGATPVKCWDLVCVATLDDCNPVFTTCSQQLVVCPDQSCKQTQSDCDSVKRTCGADFPYTCTDGMCVSEPSDCSDPDAGEDDELNHCPSYRPNKCSDGSCVKNANDCPGDPDCPNVSDTLCDDGSCASSASQCPESNGCGDCVPYPNFAVTLDSSNKCPIRCLSGHCAETTDQCNLFPLCPREAPVKCWNGLCVLSSSICTTPVQGEEETDGMCKDAARPIGCADGICVGSSEQCRPVYDCTFANEVRCPDGTCRPASKCPVGETNVLCPDERPHMCGFDQNTYQDDQGHTYEVYEGICVKTIDDCLVKTGSGAIVDDPNDGCTVSKPYRCPGGVCVPYENNQDTCDDPPPTNGCPKDSPEKCESNGECLADASECDSPAGCPWDEPNRCPDGECNNPTDGDECSDQQGCADNEQACADGACENQPKNCPSENGCPITEPRRCADGTCAHFANDPGYKTDKSICPPVSICDQDSWYPVMCDDGSCAGTLAECKNVVPCPGGDFRCANGECQAIQVDCFEASAADSGCPMATPTLCQDSNTCVQEANQCVLEDRCANGLVKCFDGLCRENYGACVDFADDAIGNCPNGFARCSDGSCMEAIEFCPAVKPCDPLFRPYRCEDGTCVEEDDDCGDAPKCNGKKVLCVDGICREDCVEYFGCAGDKPFQCLSGSCASSENKCPEESQDGRQYLRYASAVDVTYIINPTEDYASLGIVYFNGAVVFHMEVSSGSVVKSAGDDKKKKLLQVASQDFARIDISPVPHSVLYETNTVIHESRVDEFGNVLKFDDCVMSPAFLCTAEDSVAFESITVESHIDRDVNGKGDGELADEGDICLAKINWKRSAWECIEENREANKVELLNDFTVRARVLDCDNAKDGGSAYAFVLVPKPIIVEVIVTTSWLQRNWIYILIGVLIGAFVLALCGYGIIRLYRYRKKYKSAREEMEIANNELDEIAENDELGLGHLGQMGPGAHVQVNPLSQAAKGGDDEEILAEKRAMKEELERERETALRARQEIELADGPIFAHQEDMGGGQMQRRDVG